MKRTLWILAAMPRSAAGRCSLHRDRHRFAARRIAGAAYGLGPRLLRALAECRNVVQRVEVFPRHALRVGDPVLLAARVAARGLALVEKRHVGGPSARLQLGEL